MRTAIATIMLIVPLLATADEAKDKAIKELTGG